MKTHRLLRSLVLLLLVLSAPFAWAADAPIPPLIAETWTCSYKDGKGVGDVLKARDFMASQADKAGLALPSAFLWNLAKGDVSIDYVWFNVHRNIAGFGASADALAASGIAPAVSERFASVSDCVAGMSTARMIFSRGEPAASVPDGPIFVAATSCRYSDGADEESLPDLIALMNDVMTGMGDNAPAFATALMPFTLRPAGSPEVVLYSGYENATGWSNYVGELTTTEAGERLQNHIDTVLDCDGLTLWSSQRVVKVAE